MTPQNRLVQIPTKTYLKKFILSELKQSTIVEGDHPIQKFLFILLEKTDPDYHFKSLHRQYNDSISLRLSYATWHQHGYAISQKKVVAFNDYIEQLFDHELYKFCQDFIKYHKVLQEGLQEMASIYNIKLQRQHKRAWFQVPQFRSAIEAFAKKIGIEIEVDTTFDCLVKMEYRARKRIEQSNAIPIPKPRLDCHPLTFQF